MTDTDQIIKYVRLNLSTIKSMLIRPNGLKDIIKKLKLEMPKGDLADLIAPLIIQRAQGTIQDSSFKRGISLVLDSTPAKEEERDHSDTKLGLLVHQEAKTSLEKPWSAEKAAVDQEAYNVLHPMSPGIKSPDWKQYAKDTFKFVSERTKNAPYAGDPSNGGVFYHVVGRGYTPGDNLVSMDKLKSLGKKTKWKWEFDKDKYTDSGIISLHDNINDAISFQHEFGGKILKITIPPGSGLRGLVNREGYPAIFGEIPAEFIKVMGSSKAAEFMMEQTCTSNDLIDFVRQHHHTKDLYEGDIEDRISRYPVYRLEEVPLSEIDLDEWEVNIQDGSEPPPPILDANYEIIDGAHRLNAMARAAANNYPTTPKWIQRAKEFFYQKWVERASERGDSIPEDVSNACKFGSLFAQAIFGGDLRGNWNHQFIILPTGQRLDLGEDAQNRVAHGDDASWYTHDNTFWGNREHKESLQSIHPRTKQWVDEWCHIYPQHKTTVTCWVGQTGKTAGRFPSSRIAYAEFHARELEVGDFFTTPEAPETTMKVLTKTMNVGYVNLTVALTDGTAKPFRFDTNKILYLGRKFQTTASKKNNPAADKESKEINERKNTPEAKRKHKFQPAEWTHPNGHPRCRLCGDEERIGGMCEGHNASIQKVAYIAHVPGHKNSKGEAAPWVIRQHNTGKILSSHKSEAEAREHLQQMHIHKGSASGVARVCFNSLLLKVGHKIR